MSETEYVAPLRVNVVPDKPEFHRITDLFVGMSRRKEDCYRVSITVESDEEVRGLTVHNLMFYIPLFDDDSSGRPFKVFRLGRSPTYGFVLDYIVTEVHLVKEEREVQKRILQSE